ncbi:hypothetical protein NM688_g5333 [Phlebia brevispora]|uniref:Uncharacterized protein n=1 Tax=Phlebia brevispora TaxID=194682 RepID=A0ACC1SX44_9APHY|nr:hypothetical protein NM688_g5333 [Phlebia brevispora]
MRRVYRSVKPSTVVQSFDTLCEVQSDKASVEITSPFDGVVKELLVNEGEVAKVGEGLCTIEVETEDEQPEANETASANTPHLEPVTTKPNGTSSQGEQSFGTPPRRPHPMDPNAPPEFMSALGANAADVLATPSVRHFAKQKGVELSLLAPGSGKHGRIEKQDVEAYLAGSSPSAAKSAPSTDRGTTPSDAEDLVIELGRTRYGMWKAMTKSLEIPHFG